MFGATGLLTTLRKKEVKPDWESFLAEITFWVDLQPKRAL